MQLSDYQTAGDSLIIYKLRNITHSHRHSDQYWVVIIYKHVDMADQSFILRAVGETGASWRTGQDDESALVLKIITILHLSVCHTCHHVCA